MREISLLLLIWILYGGPFIHKIRISISQCIIKRPNGIKNIEEIFTPDLYMNKSKSWESN